MPPGPANSKHSSEVRHFRFCNRHPQTTKPQDDLPQGTGGLLKPTERNQHSSSGTAPVCKRWFPRFGSRAASGHSAAVSVKNDGLDGRVSKLHPASENRRFLRNPVPARKTTAAGTPPNGLHGDLSSVTLYFRWVLRPVPTVGRCLRRSTRWVRSACGRESWFVLNSTGPVGQRLTEAREHLR